MANKLKFKRGLAAGIPNGDAAEPLFTTDTYDLYIGKGDGTNQRFQKYIASGATTQILRGDGSLYTFPLAISSPVAGQVLKYNGTSWTNDSDTDTGITTLNTLTATTQTFATGTSGTDFNISSATSTHTFNIPTASATNRGALSSADWTTFNSKIGGSGTSGQVAYFNGTSSITSESNLFWDAANDRLGIGTTSPSVALDVVGQGKFSNTLSVTSNNTDSYAINIIGRTTSGNASTINFFNNAASTRYGFIYVDSSTYEIGSITGSNIPLVFSTNQTERMRVTSGGNVGIGTTSPFAYFNNGVSAKALQIVGNGRTGINLQDSSSINQYLNIGVNGVNAFIEAIYSTTPTINYNAFSSHIFITGSPSTERMRITSGGNLLVGTTTDNGNRLQVSGAATFSSSVTATAFIPSGSSVPTNGMYLPSANTLGFATASTLDMTLDASGNLGLGVTPSNALAGAKTFEFGANGILYSEAASSSFNSLAIGLNWYINASAALLYKNTGVAASRYSQYQGSHLWYSAPSGTAGNAITFTQAMTLDASGNLLLGTTSNAESARLNVQGGYVYFKETNGGDLYLRSGYGTNTDPAIQVASNDPLLFLTNNTERMRITAAGRLLLSTTTESTFLLDVNGTARVSGSSNTILTLDSSNANGYTAVQINASATAKALIGYGTYLTTDGGVAIRTAASTPFTISIGSAVPNFTIGSTGAATFSSSVTATAFIPSGSSVPTNGMYLPTTNTLAWATNSAVKMTLDASGNLGIGTTSPSYRLDVSGNIRAITSSSGISPRTDLGGTIIAEGSTRAGLYILTSGTDVGSYGSIWWGNGNINTDAFITVNNSTRAMAFGTADGERMRITSGGNVGIGTTSPLYTFHAISASTTIGAFRNSGAANGQLLVGNTVADLQLRILASGDALIFSDTSKYLAFGTNGASERMRLTSAGELLINTTTDAGDYKLQVAGNAYMTDSVVIGGTSSTTGSLDVYKGVLGVSANARFKVSGDYADAYQFRILGISAGNFNATTYASIDNSGNGYFAGNLGVGVVSPTEKLEVNGNIKTAAPSGGTAAAWKLGSALSNTGTQNREVEVEIGGSTYYLMAYVK